MKTTRNTSFSLSEAGKSCMGKEARLTHIGIVLFLMVFLSIAAVGETYGQQGVGISEAPITPHPSSILELQSTLRGFLAPRMTTAERLTIVAPAQGLLVFDTNTQSFWYYNSGWKAIASASIHLGLADQLFGMNSTGTANEYKTLGSSSTITVTHTPGDIELNTIQDIRTTASPTFNTLTLSGLTPDQVVYTNGASALTTVPPSSGVIGYWSRNNTTSLLTPANSGDNILTSGTLTANSIIKSGGLSTQFLKADGSIDPNNYLTDIAFSSSGDVIGSATGITLGTTSTLSPALTIVNDAITTAKIADDAVTSAKILDGTIVNADISATAAIDGTKISPDFGTQSISTTGTLAAGNTDISGNITVSGTVDGRNVAQDGTYQDNLQTLTGVSAGSVNLGSFGGSTISNNVSIKDALQDLETSLESLTAFAPDGNIASDNFRDAIEELGINKLDKSGGTMTGNINMGTNNITNTGTVTANSFVKAGGTSSEFLKADGSVDNTTLSSKENYLSANVPNTFTLSAGTYSPALVSVTLEEGTWMITSETTVMYNPVSVETWNATVVLGTAPTSAGVYTSGQGSATSEVYSESAITISLSKIVTITSPSTQVSIFVKSNVDATVVNTPPSDLINLSGTATAIHAVKIK